MSSARSPFRPVTDGDDPFARRGDEKYYPLVDTLRLYAGWLLTWYGVVYVLGGYQMTKVLPFSLGILEELVRSTFILQSAVGVFLFLLLTSLHRRAGGGVTLGLLLTVIGIGLFWAYRVNVL